MKTVVLTGASGFLGQHVLRSLLARTMLNDDDKLTVHALHHSTPQLEEAVAEFQNKSNKSSGSTTTTATTCIVESLDLTNKSDVEEWIKNSPSAKIDVCIHTAALSSPAACEKNPDAATAINVPQHFFDALFAHNPAIAVIALSTDQVYDGGGTPHHPPYTEASPVNPCNVYGKTKVQLEQYLLQKQRDSINSTVILLRSSILLGPTAPLVSSSAHDTFLHFCASRMQQETTFFTNEYRSVISVQDVVAVILKLLLLRSSSAAGNTAAAAGEVYCMGGPEKVSRYDMAVAVFDYHHVADQQRYLRSALKDPATDSVIVQSPLDIAMDSSKLLQFTGLATFRSLADIVDDTFSVHNNILRT